MKRRNFVAGFVVLIIITGLSLFSASLIDTGTARAQGSEGEGAESLSRPPHLNLSLAAYNPPITIPASGGTFQYQIEVKNNEPETLRFDIWTTLTLPDGSTIQGNGPSTARIESGWSVTRDDLTQFIPADSPPGTYTYKAHVGRYPDRSLVAESFTFDKLDAGGWYAQSSGTGDWFFDIHFADANNGWAVGQTNEVVHTSNGGDTWTAQNIPLFSNLWSVFAIDDQTAWAGGSLGVLLYTNDGGDTWIQQTNGVPTTGDWQGIFFLDANNGWVVGGRFADLGGGAQRRILHTSDGGATWTTQYSGSNQSPLDTVYFVDADNGWAVSGDGGSIMHTDNGGATWSTQTTGITNYFEDVYFTDVNNGWAAGRDGNVVHTTNGGSNWSIQNLGSQYDFTGVDFADANNGWISGIDQNTSQAVIFRTDDGGATWHSQNVGTSAAILFNVIFVDGNNGWAAGSNGTIINTDTGGE